MHPAIQKLEVAVFKRNPGLAQLLQPGLTADAIQKQLKRGGIGGAVEPIIELYSWRNGTQLHGNGEIFQAAYKGAFVPPRTIPMTDSEKEFMRAIGVERDIHPEQYHLMDLKNAIRTAGRFRSQAQGSPATSGALEKYFPFLWETGRGSAYIALGLEADPDIKVVKVETLESRDSFPVREAYHSFNDFLEEAIRCNENNLPLACLDVETKPIFLPATTTPPLSRAVSSVAIPVGENVLVVRTDFSDDAAWKALLAAIQSDDDEFGPSFDYVSNPAFDGLTPDRLPSFLSGDSRPSFALIVDRIALTRPDHPALVVDLRGKPGKTFRADPSTLEDIAQNLSLANMGFDDFANAVGKDGVFRGFE